MNNSLLELLHCPFCGGEFSLTGSDKSPIESGYGILTCYCSSFPIVDGIPVLKRGKIIDEIIALIKTGQNIKALLALMPKRNFSVPSIFKFFSIFPSKIDNLFYKMSYDEALKKWQNKALSLLSDQGGRNKACDFLEFFMQQREHYYYFAFRFGQPRHLAALSFANLIQSPKSPVLDLSCGCGHITRNLTYRAKDTLVIGIDEFFLGLYIAKHWIAPKAEYVCCSSDVALPFPDSLFSAVFCSDAFQYNVNKLITVSELKRLIQNEGLILLAWVRNALQSTDGVTLPPEGYQRLVADMPHRIIGDRNVLSRYLEKKGPLLAQQVPMKYLHEEPTLSIAASYQQNIFRDYGAFDSWPHAEGRLRLNPLYIKEEGDAGNLFIRRFPSQAYEEKHGESKKYMPEKVEIDPELLDDLENGEYTSDMEKLIKQCVILDIPEMYI